MTLEYQRIGGVLGAEVLGFDVANSHPKALWEELRGATMERCLLLSRDREFSAPQLTTRHLAIATLSPLAGIRATCSNNSG